MVYFHKVAKSNQSVFPARGHSKRKGVFIMKKLTALLLSLCMVLTMACATALAEGKTASATAEGFGGGNVTVTLSVDGDKLVNVEIDATSQTDSIGGAAAKVLAEQMLANNSVEVDGVTAATVTSDAVKAAAAAALAELGLTNADLAKVEAAEKETYTDLTCDVLVIGTGAAGGAAAMAAAEAGAKVIAIEKLATIGGTSAMAGGGIAAPESSEQKSTASRIPAKPTSICGWNTTTTSISAKTAAWMKTASASWWVRRRV